jgi:hypothetical protein
MIGLLMASKYKQINSEGCKLWAGGEEKPIKPIRIPALSPEELKALEELEFNLSWMPTLCGPCGAPRANS